MLLSKIFANKKKSREISPEDIFLDARNVSDFDVDSSEGVFEKPFLKDSFIIISGFTFVIFVVFLFKAYSLQVTNYSEWATRSINNYIKKAFIFSYRGMIRDRNGVALAWNDSVDSKLTTLSEIPLRHYIEDEGFSNLLGTVSYPKRDKSGYFWQDDYVGVDGLEKYYNDNLSGTKGDRIVEVDVKGEVVRDNVLNNPVDGKVLNLNIDSKVQSIFYNRLSEVVRARGFDGGSGILMDITNGEVIAAASYPDFDNNVFVNATTTEDRKTKNSFLSQKDTPMLNRALSGLYVPGSVVKPFMAYAALKEGVIDEYTNIFSSGQLVIKNKYGGPDTIFRDWKAHGYVDVRSAIAVSSDEYFYQVGGGFKDQVGLGIKRIDQYMSMFGFASTTGVDFIAEKTSIIPTPEWKKKNFEDGDWLLGNTYHSSIGQYGYKTSPIALARSVGIIATGGKIIIPSIARTETSSARPIYSQVLDLNKANLLSVREGMRKSASEGGTAHYFDNLPFSVGAKTGTAQLGYKNERVNSWSTGYYPYDNPKYVFVFMMENGPSSNTVGASKIMRQVFQDMLDLKLPYVTFN